MFYFTFCSIFGIIIHMINEKMKHLINKRGISQIEAAKMLGIEVGRLNHWLIGRRQPNIENIKKFCEVFGSTPNYLMGFEDDITDTDRQLLKIIKSATQPETKTESPIDNPKQIQIRGG